MEPLTLTGVDRICVVGNGPSLLDQRHGKAIDGHDLVVRINNFQTLGYEDFSGTKTDVWATCGWQTRDRIIRDFDMVLITNNIGIHKSEGWCKKFTNYMKMQEHFPDTHVDFMSVPLIQWLNKQAAPRFSAGCAAVGWFLRHCPQATISVVGFDHFQGRGLHHYMDDKQRPHGCPHSGKSEEKFFETMEKEGRLRRL